MKNESGTHEFPSIFLLGLPPIGEKAYRRKKKKKKLKIEIFMVKDRYHRSHQ